MYYAFCDDDAMIRESQPAPNRFAHHLGHAVLRGPIVIVKTDYEGETRSLRSNDVAHLEMLLAAEPSQEALESARREHQFWTDHPSGFVIQTLNPATGQWE
jgi:hypothetical protein